MDRLSRGSDDHVDLLLYRIDTETAAAATDAFLGEWDTPTVIWNMAMREHLMVEIAEYTREFRCRVHDNPLARFEYVQMPAVSYVRLKDEVSKV